MTLPEITKEHTDALGKAKIALMAKPDTAFFTTLAFSLQHKLDWSVPTAETDGRTVWYNPDFLMKQTPEARVGLMVHEIMHVAYIHMDEVRCRGKNHEKWVRACDYVINLQIVDRGFEIPPGGCLDRRYAGMSADEVYKLLPDDPSAPKPSMMDIKVASGPTGAGLEAEVQDILVRATIASKMAGDKPGTVPSDIEIYLEKILNPKLPWTTILRKYLQAFAKNDYSWMRPSRRFFPEHHLPSLYGHALIDMVMAVDISGSVSDHEFRQQVSETANILKMLKPQKMTLLPFQSRLEAPIVIRSIMELLQVKFTGRGGTNIRPVIEYANKHKPQVMLVFSDGEFAMPKDRPTKTEFIWLIYNNPRFTAPFGKVIHYEIIEP